MTVPTAGLYSSTSGYQLFGALHPEREQTNEPIHKVSEHATSGIGRKLFCRCFLVGVRCCSHQRFVSKFKLFRWPFRRLRRGSDRKWTYCVPVRRATASPLLI